MDTFWDVIRILVVGGAICFIVFAATFEGIALRDQNEKKDGSK